MQPMDDTKTSVCASLHELYRSIQNGNQKVIITKVMTNADEDKIYLSGYEQNKDNKKKNVIGTIKVLGTMKKDKREAYDIKIFDETQEKGTLWCSCAYQKFSAGKQNTCCKHITFVIIRVMKYYNTQFFETKRLSRENIMLLISKLSTDNIMLDIDIAKIPKVISLNSYKQFVKDVKDEDCAICCMSLEDNREQNNVVCITCKNDVHTECISVWLENPAKTCIYCRSDSWKYFNRVKSGETINI